MSSSPGDEGSAQDFAPNDEFFRRVPPDCIKPDGTLASKAFSNSTNTSSMSVNWAALSSVDDTLKGYAGYGVASITAELCWSLNQEITYSPLTDNPAHCDVVGQKTQSIRRKFARAAKLLYRSGAD